MDVELERGNPSQLIPLECLQEGVIAGWWRQVKTRGFAVPYAPKFQPISNDYDMWSNNCSTIVLTAMKVGGAERILPFQAGIVTPEHICYYAVRLRARGG
jgi:hypothetical protein